MLTHDIVFNYEGREDIKDVNKSSWSSGRLENKHLKNLRATDFLVMMLLEMEVWEDDEILYLIKSLISQFDVQTTIKMLLHHHKHDVCY